MMFDRFIFTTCKSYVLQGKAKAAGLWNLFMPKESDRGVKYGTGLSSLEYALMCEEMSKCPLSSEVITKTTAAAFNTYIIPIIVDFHHKLQLLQISAI